MYLAQKVNCAAPSAGHCDKYITAKPACVSRLELNKTIVNRSWLHYLFRHFTIGRLGFYVQSR